MKIDVLNMLGEKVDTAELPEAVFKVQVKPDLMHQALVRQQANARLGTHKTKTRAEVAGGGIKPWRQKGTGRARHGSIRSPIWVGGGKAHTPRPRDYEQRMPRKMRRAALRSALSLKAGNQQITVLDELKLSGPKTKEIAGLLRNLSGGQSALILLPEKIENIEKSVRNLVEFKTVRAQYVNVRDLLQFERLILPLQAVGMLQTILDPGVKSK